MELTKEQILQVEGFLHKKKFNFIDLKVEILDHIISDIESKITKENIDFEIAFYNVTDKWNAHLKHSSSYMFGTLFSVPKIVLEKAKKRFSKWFFIPFLIFFATYFLIEKSSYFLPENVLDEFNMLFQFLSVSSFIVFVTFFLLKYKLKTSTTYSFILNTQSLNLFMALIILFDYNYINRDGTLDSIQVSILMCYIYSTYTYFHFYRKHKEVIKKYKNL